MILRFFGGDADLERGVREALCDDANELNHVLRHRRNGGSKLKEPTDFAPCGQGLSLTKGEEESKILLQKK